MLITPETRAARHDLKCLFDILLPKVAFPAFLSAYPVLVPEVIIFIEHVAVLRLRRVPE